MEVDAHTLLRLTDLTVDFESQEGIVHAVDKVSFSVAPRELVSLVFSLGLAIMITVLDFNLVGDGLRDAFDPHQRRR